MLVISILLDLKTMQVDYTADLLHANIVKEPNWDRMSETEREKSGVYVKMPKTFAKTGKFLRIRESLYNNNKRLLF
jgi:hypothetical protein